MNKTIIEFFKGDYWILGLTTLEFFATLASCYFLFRANKMYKKLFTLYRIKSHQLDAQILSNKILLFELTRVRNELIKYKNLYGELS